MRYYFFVRQINSKNHQGTRTSSSLYTLRLAKLAFHQIVSHQQDNTKQSQASHAQYDLNMLQLSSATALGDINQVMQPHTETPTHEKIPHYKRKEIKTLH